jgi:hypothetical protein
MTRQEAQERLQKAEQEIKEVEQYLKTHPEGEIIRVPDNIKIEGTCGYGDTLGIRFDRHILFWGENTWGVGTLLVDRDLIPCELIPVKKTDRKIGYKYHFTDDIETSISFLKYYGIYTGSGFICIDDKFPVKIKDDLRYYYQVVPIKEQV